MTSGRGVTSQNGSHRNQSLHENLATSESINDPFAKWPIAEGISHDVKRSHRERVPSQNWSLRNELCQIDKFKRGQFKVGHLENRSLRKMPQFEIKFFRNCSLRKLPSSTFITSKRGHFKKGSPWKENIFPKKDHYQIITSQNGSFQKIGQLKNDHFEISIFRIPYFSTAPKFLSHLLSISDFFAYFDFRSFS